MASIRKNPTSHPTICHVQLVRKRKLSPTQKSVLRHKYGMSEDSLRDFATDYAFSKRSFEEHLKVLIRVSQAEALSVPTPTLAPREIDSQRARNNRPDPLEDAGFRAILASFLPMYGHLKEKCKQLSADAFRQLMRALKTAVSFARSCNLPRVRMPKLVEDTVEHFLASRADTGPRVYEYIGTIPVDMTGEPKLTMEEEKRQCCWSFSTPHEFKDNSDDYCCTETAPGCYDIEYIDVVTTDGDQDCGLGFTKCAAEGTTLVTTDGDYKKDDVVGATDGGHIPERSSLAAVEGNCVQAKFMKLAGLKLPTCLHPEPSCARLLTRDDVVALKLYGKRGLAMRRIMNSYSPLPEGTGHKPPLFC